MPDSTSDWLTETDTYEESVDIGGRDVEIEVSGATVSELEDLAANAEDELEEMQAVIDEYLVAVDGEEPPAAGDVGLRKLTPLYQGVQNCWAGQDVIDEARDEMPIDQGNG